MPYFIFNETDGIYAYPDAVSRKQARRIVRQLRRRYLRQGFYAAVTGRIPVSELRLRLIPAE